MNKVIEDVLGFEVLRNIHRDAALLFLAKSVRMFSFGFLAVCMALYLQELGFSVDAVGELFMLTLLGDAVISLFITSHGDKWGRRWTLLLSTVIAVITSIIFAAVGNFWVLMVTAILGVISPSGAEIGPFMPIEISGLAQVSPDSHRTRLLAWYNLLSSVSSAVGALLCGGLIRAFQNGGYPMLMCYRAMMIIYAILQSFKLPLFYNLSEAVEVPPKDATVKNANPVSLFLGLHKSKGIVMKLSALFMLDAFAGTFVLQSLLSAWFYATYGTSAEKLGAIVFVCNIVAGVSALFAAKLADHIGLIMTMVVTHMPSNVLLILVPLMPNEALAITMLCFRFCISQMDVPTRNAYVQGVVDPDERSAANGVTNVVRSIGGSLGPYIGGLLYAQHSLSSVPFFIAGGLKIVYDISLLLSMRHVKPDTERAAPVPETSPTETDDVEGTVNSPLHEAQSPDEQLSAVSAPEVPSVSIQKEEDLLEPAPVPVDAEQALGKSL
jgi:MFS family permease